MTDHMGDLQRRLQAIEDRSAAEHGRKALVVAVIAAVLVIGALTLWWMVDQRQNDQERQVCEYSQVLDGMTAAEAQDYCD